MDADLGYRWVIIARRFTKLPIMMFPLWISNEEMPVRVKELLSGGAGVAPYQTVIRLPLESSMLELVRAKIEEDILPENIIFLGTLEEVTAFDHINGKKKVIKANWNVEKTIVEISGEGFPGADKDPLVFKVFSNDIAVSLPDGTNETRNVQVAARLKEGNVCGDELYPFFNYYPLTDEELQLPLLLHGEFEVDPGRTKFNNDYETLNIKVLEGLADLIASKNTSCNVKTVHKSILDGEFSAFSVMPSLLLPKKNEKKLSGIFRNLLIERLKAVPCVPCGHVWELPSKIVYHDNLLEYLDVVIGNETVLGLRLPCLEARTNQRFYNTVEELGAVKFTKETLFNLLDTGFTNTWQDIPKFRNLYSIIRALVAHPSENRSFLDRYRPTSKDPKDASGKLIGLIPCKIPVGGVKVFPLMYRRAAGGQTDAEKEFTKSETRIFYRSSLDHQWSSPPEGLRLNFIHDDVLRIDPADSDTHKKTLVDASVKAFAEDILDVQQYEIKQVLTRLLDIEIPSFPDSEKKQLAVFIFDFLLNYGEKGEKLWSLTDRDVLSFIPRPDLFYAGCMDNLEARDARTGLSKIFIPSANGELCEASTLRFDGSWGECYYELDTFNPNSLNLVASVDFVVEYLDAVRIVERLEGERFSNLEDLCKDGRLPPGDSSSQARALVWAFLRHCGVWETIPVDYIDSANGITFDEAIKRIPRAETLIEEIRSNENNWNSFGTPYSHDNTRITQTWWFRDGEVNIACSGKDKSRAFLALLAKSWGCFFGKFATTRLRCVKCHRHESVYNNHYSPQPPSFMFWVLQTIPWYHSPESIPSMKCVHEGAIAPLEMWSLPDTPPDKSRLSQSPFRFLPHLRETDESYLQVFHALGVPRFSRARLAQYVYLLETLQKLYDDPGIKTNLRDSSFRIAFVGIHREIYSRIQDSIKKVCNCTFKFENVRPLLEDGRLFVTDGSFKQTDWQRLVGLQVLVEKNRQLDFMSASQSLIDEGSDSFGRNLFRAYANFMCVNEDGRILGQLLGAQLFKIKATAKPEGKHDITAESQEILQRFIPYFSAVMGSFVPGGGTPPDIESEEFQRRLQKLRSCKFVHCDDLVVEYAIEGFEGSDSRRQPIPSQELGHRDKGDSYLDATGEGPTIYFDHDVTNGNLHKAIGKLTPEYSRVLQAERYEYIFTILLSLDSDKEILAFLEGQGVGEEELRRASDVINQQDTRQIQRITRIWRATTSCSPFSGTTISRISSMLSQESNIKSTEAVMTSIMNKIEEALRADGNLVKQVAVNELLRHMVNPEALEDVANGSFLWRLEKEFAVDLKEFSEKLVENGIDPISIRTHFHAMRSLKSRHFQTLVAAFYRKNSTVSLEEIKARVNSLLLLESKSYFKVEFPELLDVLGGELSLFGLPTPDITMNTSEYSHKLYPLLGFETHAQFSEFIRGVFSPDELRNQEQRQFEEFRRSWRPILVGISITSADVRTDQIQSRIESFNSTVGFIPGSLLSPFKSWLEQTTLSHELGSIVITHLSSHNEQLALEEIVKATGRDDLQKIVLRVRRLLNSERRTRVADLKASYEQYKGAKLAGEVKPIQTSESKEQEQASEKVNSQIETNEKDQTKRKMIKKGAFKEDAAERKRKGLMGEKGEQAAFAWAMKPLVALYSSDHMKFMGIARELRNQLDDWDYNDDVVIAQFDEAFNILTDPFIIEEELLEALQMLCHLSGERSSDGFGFDILTWRQDSDQDEKGQVILLEVKTSKGLNESFHFSRNQYDTAIKYQDKFAILRVILEPNKNPSLFLFYNPTKLEQQSEKPITFVPESYLGSVHYKVSL